MVQSRRKKTKKDKYNTLYFYANQYYEGVTNRAEIEEINMTETFINELDTMIENGEIVIIQANAKMRLGKSTLILALALHIWNLLIKYKHRKQEERFTVKKNIAMDQMEFDYKMRDPETTFTVIATDEENDSEDTGQDITAIRALQRDQSNIQADRYVHRVSASPTGLADPNTDIILDITSLNRKDQTIRANLTYRWYEQMTEKTQLVGYIIIPVGHVIGNWDKHVKPKFYEKLKLESRLSAMQKTRKANKITQEERKVIEQIDTLAKFIKKWEKRDWYVEYYMKKRKKIELVSKYKVTKPRLLRYAPIIITVIERFRSLCKHGNLVKKEMVKNNIKLEMRKAGFPQSIVGEELTTGEVIGVLEGYKSYWQITRQQQKNFQLFRAGKITADQYKEADQDFNTVKVETMNNVTLQLEEYKNCLKIIEEYEREYSD